MAQFTRVDQVEIRAAAQRSRWKKPQKPPRARIIGHEKIRRQRQALPCNRGIDGKISVLRCSVTCVRRMLDGLEPLA